MADRWGAIILGHALDLQDWVDALNPAFDPWVEVHGKDYVLCSTSFEGMTSAEGVRQNAISYIGLLNGAMAVFNRSRPVQFAGVANIAENGQVHRILFAEGLLEGRSKAHAVAVTLGQDGQLLSLRPQKSQVQTWSELADRDELLEDALIYFGRATARIVNDAADPDWFDIYKTIECLIMRFGPKEDQFYALDWVPKSARNIKQTANWARHARQKYDAPKTPVTIDEARDTLALLIRTVFEKVTIQPK